MSADDENRFRPKPGRIRSDTPKAGGTKSFFTEVRKITRQHQAAASRDPSMPSSARPSSPGRSRAVVASGKGVKRGRGASFVRARNISGNWHHRQPGSRRVIVKQRSVRAAWKGGRARAHLRYVQRDGTSRDGERSRLYSATEDRADGVDFLDRGKDDRHQFRFFVLGPDGEPQIVNSRVHRNVLIVDRLFGAAELRLGSGERQQVVRIVRSQQHPAAVAVPARGSATLSTADSGEASK